MPSKRKNRELINKEKRYETRIAIDALRRLCPEEQKAVSNLIRRRFRRRPERLRIKSLKVEAETARGLRPILTSNGNADFVIHGHNPERVNLGSIGDLDFYCYPNLWDDKVFIGMYPNSVSLEHTNINHLQSLVMRARWALKKSMNTTRIRKILEEKSYYESRNRGFKRDKKRIRGKFGAKNSAFD